MEGSLHLQIDWASLTVRSKFTVLRAIFQVQAPRGPILEGQFNGRFFASLVWGTYIWRGLFLEFYSIQGCR